MAEDFVYCVCPHDSPEAGLGEFVEYLFQGFVSLSAHVNDHNLAAFAAALSECVRGLCGGGGGSVVGSRVVSVLGATGGIHATPVLGGGGGRGRSLGLFVVHRHNAGKSVFI